MDKEQITKFKEEARNKKLPKQELNPERELPAPKWWEKIIEFFRRHTTKRIVIFSIVILVLLSGALILKMTVFKPDPKQIYSVAVVVRSQNNPDKVEDQRTSLKSGDVLIATDETHKWSRTEKVSYLLLKMNLTEEQAQKLTSAEEREIPDKELSEEEKNRIEEEKKQAKEEDREYEREPRTVTLRTREYYIDLKREEFEGFQANDLLSKQPYLDQVFDWEIVNKKKSVLKEK